MTDESLSKKLAEDGTLLTPAKVREVKNDLVDRFAGFFPEEKSTKPRTKEQTDAAVIAMAEVVFNAKMRTYQGCKKVWEQLAKSNGIVLLLLVQHKIEKELEPRYLVPGQNLRDELLELSHQGYDILETVEIWSKE